MGRFVIDSRYLGTSRHVVGDVDGYAVSDSVPRDAWHLDGRLKSGRCLDTLLRLEGKTPARPPEKYTTIATQLVPVNVDVPWRHFLPEDVFRIFFRNVVEETKETFSKLPFDYHETVWMAGNRLLSSLRPAKIDATAFEAALAVNPGSPGLESFRPKRSGFSHPVAYDRLATRTGRLTVTDGPNILLLKKEYRKILRTSFDEGEVVSLDFRALEARVVLAETDRRPPTGDLYDQLAMSLFGGSVNRDVVKTAVIAELYGASRSSLGHRLGVSQGQLDEFISVIRRHFDVDALRRRLRESMDTMGRTRSRFGRPITVPAGQEGILVNSYAQSTGVDVSILGFDSVVTMLGTEGIRPLFVLHDALILDVRRDRLADVNAIDSVSIQGYEYPFPLKLEKLSSEILP